MNIIKRKNIFLTFSALLVTASLAAVLVFGFKPGIDFEGGTLWQFRLPDREITKTELQDYFNQKFQLSDVIITQQRETKSFIVRAQEISENDHQAFLNSLNVGLGKVEELRFESIGPAIGSELKRGAVTAFVLVLFSISLYIAFAFRKVSHPVSSWKYGLITLITLFHDAVIATGFFALLGALTIAEVDTNFIVAILVVIGFSVHDTIVVFDRIRENLRLAAGKLGDFGELVNKSINETIARSINTSLTLFLILVAMYFLGAPVLKNFVSVILVGTIVGTYSSIFVASPLLVIWQRFKRGK